MKIDNISALLYGLVRNDREKTETAFACCIADEKEGRVKTRLKYILDEYHRRQGMEVVEKLMPGVRNLVSAPYRDCSFDDLFLSDDIKSDTENILSEWASADYLIENGLMPTNKILLEGPPGNGKTSYAIALAKRLGLSILCTSSSLMLDSYLGKSEQNVNVLFRNLPEKCVLFFDEFESMASTRGRVGEDGGGAGRAWNSIVTSFLVNMETIKPSIILLAATNRSELLDKAIVRRFDMRIGFDNPTEDEKRVYVDRYIEKYGLGRDSVLTNKVCKKVDKAVSYSALEKVMKKRHKEILLEKLLKDKGQSLF